MGKRSSFERIPRDFYPTPEEAVSPLLPHLERGTRYFEPCAGDGALVRHLSLSGHTCLLASDIAPAAVGIEVADARHLSFSGALETDRIITNPPWDRNLLHELIIWFSDQAPTWLLFDADWMHTRQATPYMPRLRKIVSVGRVKWISDSPFTGKDNCAWYLFSKPDAELPTFFGRS